jgi:hypothetical protein
VTDLTPLSDDGSTGTTVRFLPDTTVVPPAQVSTRELRTLAARFAPELKVDIIDERLTTPL